MPRYIDADALIKVGNSATMGDVFPDWLNMSIAEKEAVCKHGQFLKTLIEQLPPVDAQPVVHGRWIDLGRNYYTVVSQCSECGAKYDFRSPYCLNCGAKMDGDGDV